MKTLKRFNLLLTLFCFAVIGVAADSHFRTQTIYLEEPSSGGSDVTKIAGPTISGDKTLTIPAPSTDDSFVLEDTTQTLTNKTIDGDDNTLQNIPGSAIAADAAIDYSKLSLTGNILNADLGESVAITRGGTGQATKTSAFDALAPTTTKGDIIVSDGTDNIRVGIGEDGQVLTAASGETSGVKWEDGGAGAGEINYITSPSDSDDWTDTGDGITPSTTTTDAELPRIGIDRKALKLTNDGSGTDGVSICLQVGEADKNKKLKVEWAQLVGADVDAGDFTYKLVSDTASDCSGTETGVTLHSSGDSDAVSIPAQNGVMYDEFDADDSDYYQLYILRAAGSASEYISISNLVIGPGKLHSGAVVTKWEAFTPTSTNWGTTNVSFDGHKRRVGTDMEVWARASLTGAPNNAELDIVVPDSKAIDTTAVPENTATAKYGFGQMLDAGSGRYDLTVVGNSTTSVLVRWLDDSAAGLQGKSISATSPITWASGDVVLVKFTVPIAEWAGSGVLNTIVQDNLSERTTITTSVSDFNNNTDLTLNAESNLQWKRLGDSVLLTGMYRFASDGSSTSDLEFNLSVIENAIGATIDTTQIVKRPITLFLAGTGVVAGMFRVGAGASVATLFAGAAALNGDEFGSTSGNYSEIWIEFSLPVTGWVGSQSCLVGFTEAKQGESGLVQSAGQLKGTNTNDDAVAGYVGEYLTDDLGLDEAAVCGSYSDLASVTLTPGDWDVWGQVVLPAGGTAVTSIAAAVSTSTTGIDNLGLGGWTQYDRPSSALASTTGLATGVRRFSVATDTTVYVVSHVNCSSPPNFDDKSKIMARRVR